MSETSRIVDLGAVFSRNGVKVRVGWRKVDKLNKWRAMVRFPQSWWMETKKYASNSQEVHEWARDKFEKEFIGAGATDFEKYID